MGLEELPKVGEEIDKHKQVKSNIIMWNIFNNKNNYTINFGM